EQIGSPIEVYEAPATAFCADFIGSLNTLQVRVDDSEGHIKVMRLDEGQRITLPGERMPATGTVPVAIRPERIQVHRGDQPVAGTDSRLRGVVADVVYLGMTTQIHVDSAVGRLVSHILSTGGSKRIWAGDEVTLSWG